MTKSELLLTYTAEQLAERYLNLLDRYNKREECYKKIINTLPEELKQGTEFHLEIDRLQSEVEKYRRAFKAARKEIEELNGKLKIQTVATKYAEEYVNSLKNDLDRSQTTINQIDNILKDLFGATFEICETKEDFDGYKRFLEKNIKASAISNFLPAEPIKIADTLIDNAMKLYNSYVEVFAKSHSGELVIGNPCEDVRRQTFSYLRQIAEHLLVYCNANGEAEE